MNRIGIITHYYNSRNYGGSLQAYALCRSIEKKGGYCEQISYSVKHFEKNSKVSKFQGIRKYVRGVLNIFTKSAMLKRSVLFDDFLNGIPHSKMVYSDDTIARVVDEYDTFVTGSDQVWNLNWFHAPYFLDFVPKTKKKFSYAASMGGCTVDENEKTYLKKVLTDYSGISVRESKTTELLMGIIPENVEYVLDPTLLLSNEDWNKVCPCRIIKEKYIFCYFLGADKELRKIAKKFAQTKKMKLVSIPHLQNKTEMRDMFLGGIKLPYASPLEFVSLVRDAEYVLTDSFHASVFSCIFHKQFFVFDRIGYPLMSERIDALCEIFSAQSHFCKSNTTRCCSYIDSVDDLPFDCLDKYYNLLDISYGYLEEIIGGSDEKAD